MAAGDALTFPQFFASVCEQHAERVAVRFEGRNYTYAELWHDAVELAHGLGKAGVKKGTHVGILFGNRPEWIVSAMASSLAGAVMVPLSTFSTARERAHQLAHSDTEVLLFQARLLKRDYMSELLESGLATVRRSFCWGLDVARGPIEPWSALLGGHGESSSPTEELSQWPTAAPMDPGILLYTSGTSAEPKAILHAHRGPVSRCLHFARFLDLTVEDRMWTAQPFFWAAGIAVSLGGTFTAGGSLVLQETFSARDALALIEKERATVVRAWPHQEKAMADEPGTYDLSSVKKLNFNSPLASRVGLTVDEWGTQGGYGLSETFTVAADTPSRAAAALRTSQNGLPVDGCEIAILDEQGRSLPTGSEGEIAVRGPALMLGYYKGDSGRDENGFFHTRDSGWLDADGRLHWTGRLSNLIKTGGANVSPLEVERALVGHALVRQAVVLGIPHPHLGEEVVLCVVPTGELDEATRSDTLREFLRARLATYKVPRRILYFSDGEIPMTGTEKVRLGELKAAVLLRLEA